VNALDRATAILAKLEAVADPTRDEIAEAIDAGEQAVREAKAIRERIESIATAWIQANEEIRIGDIRYYVGMSKTIKPKSIPAIYSALIAQGQDAMLACLNSDPFKQGTVKKTLGECAWGELYEVRIKANLETGEVTEKLKKANDNF